MAGLALAAGAVEAKPKPHKPPKPHPKLTLLTGTEEGVLRREADQGSRRHRPRLKRARVTNHFVVEGYPSDFPFDLRPQTGEAA